MALVDPGLAAGTPPCVVTSTLKSGVDVMGVTGEDTWPEEIFDFGCLPHDDGHMETSGAPNTPPDFEQDHASVARSQKARRGGGSSPESGRESTEGAGMHQSGSMPPVSDNSDHPHPASADGVGGGEEHVASPHRPEGQTPAVSDKSSGKASGKGSGKASMEGSGEGPVKSSRADGPFDGARHYNGAFGKGDATMAEDTTDDIDIFLRNLSWWWRSEDMHCKLFAVQQFQTYSCNREHAMVIAQTSGAIRFLVHILQLDYCPGNDPCKVAAGFAMQNLAYHCTTTRERIAQAGAIPVLIQLLQSLDDAVREASAGCLANLAMEPGILDDIVARDGVPFMLQLLRSSSLGCMEEGLCFLFLFASKSYDSQVLLARYGIIPLLVHMLAKCLSQRAKRLIGLFWTMYLPCADRLVQHELAKVTPLLMQMMQFSTPEVQDAAAILLADFCKAEEDNAHLVRKAGGIPHFTQLYHARSNTHPVWHRVVDVLMGLGIDMFQDDILAHSAAAGVASGGTASAGIPPLPRTCSSSALKSGNASRACSAGTPTGTGPAHSQNSNPRQSANAPAHHMGPMCAPPPGAMIMRPGNGGMLGMHVAQMGHSPGMMVMHPHPGNAMPAGMMPPAGPMMSHAGALMQVPVPHHAMPHNGLMVTAQHATAAPSGPLAHPMMPAGMQMPNGMMSMQPGMMMQGGASPMCNNGMVPTNPGPIPMSMANPMLAPSPGGFAGNPASMMVPSPSGLFPGKSLPQGSGSAACSGTMSSQQATGQLPVGGGPAPSMPHMIPHMV